MNETPVSRNMLVRIAKDHVWLGFYAFGVFFVPIVCATEGLCQCVLGTPVPTMGMHPLCILAMPVIAVLIGSFSASLPWWNRVLLLLSAVPIFLFVFAVTVVVLFHLGLGEAT